MQLGGRILELTRRAARAPTLHFLAIGASLFAVHALVSPDRAADQRDRVIVAPAERAQMFVEDEVLYREALSLGLHRDDPMVRRRMVQKMRFLLEDTAPLATPTNAELTAYMQAHQAKFRLPATCDIEQLFFSRDRRGDKAATDATRALQQLGRNQAPASDAFALGRVLRGRTHAQLAQSFGGEFADSLRAQPLGQWRGPVRSGYGVHVVRITARSEGGLPALSRVRNRVLSDYVREQRSRAAREAINVLRARYKIDVAPKS